MKIEISASTIFTLVLLAIAACLADDARKHTNNAPGAMPELFFLDIPTDMQEGPTPRVGVTEVVNTNPACPLIPESLCGKGNSGKTDL